MELESGIRVVETAQWATVATLPDAAAPVRFSSDSEHLASAGDGLVRVTDTGDWSSETFSCPRLSDAAFPALTWIPNGSQIAVTALGSETILLLDTATGEEVTDIPARGSVAIAASPDGKLLAESTWHGEVVVWELETFRQIHRWKAHHGLAQGINFSPDGTRLATGGNDQIVKLWRVPDFESEGILKGHRSEIWTISSAADGTLVSSGKDGIVRVWESSVSPPSGEERWKDSGLERTSPHQVVGMDGNGLSWVDMESGSLNHLDLGDGTSKSTKQLPVAFPSHWQNRAPRLVSGGSRIAVGSDDGDVTVIDSTDGSVVGTQSFGTSPVRPVAVDRSGRWVAVFVVGDGGSDYEGTLIDMTGGAEPVKLQGFVLDTTYPGSAFSPDGKLLAYPTGNFVVKIIDLASGQPVSQLEGHRWHINNLEFAPDQKRVATFGWDGEARIWDIETGELEQVLVGHQSGIWQGTFSPDGRTLATCADDLTVRLWSVATGQEMVSFQNSDCLRMCPIIAPGGDRLIMLSSKDHALRVINVGHRRTTIGESAQ